MRILVVGSSHQVFQAEEAMHFDRPVYTIFRWRSPFFSELDPSLNVMFTEKNWEIVTELERVVRV